MGRSCWCARQNRREITERLGYTKTKILSVTAPTDPLDQHSLCKKWRRHAIIRHSKGRVMSDEFEVHGPHDHALDHAAEHGRGDSFASRIAVSAAVLATV